MKIKPILLTIAVAAASGALTTLAVSRVAAGAPSTDTLLSSPAMAPGADGLVRVGSRPPVNTDFTRAAESTVEGVVSIKSYANAAARSRGSQGIPEEMLSDPFFEFFFGPWQHHLFPY